MTLLELLACALLVLVSSFVASSEIALFSLTRFQLRSLKERFRTQHRQIKRLLSDPGGLLLTLLVTNEVVNVWLSTLIAGAVERSMGDQPALGLPPWAVHTLLATLITAPIVLLFCEVTPKTIAARANQLLAPLAVGPLTLVYDAYKPIRWFLNRVMRSAARAAGRVQPEKSASTDSRPILREREFMDMIEEGHREGAIRAEELELIRNVFELDDRTVADVLTPISQVFSIPQNTTLRNALAQLRGRKWSRIPVTGRARDHVVGTLYAKDLLYTKLEIEDLADSPVSNLMRRPLTVSATLRLNALFRKMKQNKTHMAVVEGSPGVAFGVVTMDDVLDALFEDLLEAGEEPA